MIILGLFYVWVEKIVCQIPVGIITRNGLKDDLVHTSIQLSVELKPCGSKGTESCPEEAIKRWVIFSEFLYIIFHVTSR